MRDCDTLLIVGSKFPYSQFLPKFGKARGVQIDIDGSLIGMRYPTELNIVADARATLQALLPRLVGHVDRAWREKTEENVAAWWRTMERQAMVDADPINPMRVVWELSQRLPGNAIVTADSGSAANWYARHLRVHGDVRGSLSGTLATMGPAVPYAIGAKFAHPDRPAIAITGDGAMQMNGMAELLTIARYRERWDDQRLVVAVLHNNDLNQVTWELRAMGGAPKFEESQVLPDLSYADFASSIGLDGITVRDPNDLGPAWEHALESSGPTVLDVHCDPEVPPIPPHATLEEAVSMVEAVLKGDRSSLHLMMQGIKTKLQEVLP
jgi:pyruvate dehydrogenase (quinone)